MHCWPIFATARHFIVNQRENNISSNTSTPQPLKSVLLFRTWTNASSDAGNTWVPAWTLRDNKSFSELVLDKMKGPTEKLPVKCRKIDKKTKVITDEVMHKRYDKYVKRNQRKNLHPQSYRKIELKRK